eukprot:814264-Prorocentrum_minimum.AAC.2
MHAHGVGDGAREGGRHLAHPGAGGADKLARGELLAIDGHARGGRHVALPLRPLRARIRLLAHLRAEANSRDECVDSRDRSVNSRDERAHPRDKSANVRMQ